MLSNGFLEDSFNEFDPLEFSAYTNSGSFLKNEPVFEGVGTNTDSVLAPEGSTFLIQPMHLRAGSLPGLGRFLILSVHLTGRIAVERNLFPRIDEVIERQSVLQIEDHKNTPKPHYAVLEALANALKTIYLMRCTH
jgi:hypothetical protein